MSSPPADELLTARRARADVPPSLEKLLVRAAREVQLLASLTPAHAQHERARLLAALRDGRRATPSWTYAPVAHDELRRALDEAERSLARVAGRSPEHELYLARVRELSVEASLCAAAGTNRISSLARQRFAPSDPAVARAASGLCAEWLEQPAPPAAGSPLVSDDPDPRSLLSRMRETVGRLRLPFAVVAHASLAPLAATGDSVILVAAGRPVHEEDTARTVIHEVEGHARPRARSRDASIALLRVGTARGVDDQEGRALVLEERAGMLGPRRRHHLAARHRAVEAMIDGASFAEVASMMVEAHGLDPGDAILISERAFRGGDGTFPGLGRERVYLESFVRMRAHLAERPEDEQLIAAGQVAVDAVPTLRAWAARS